MSITRNGSPDHSSKRLPSEELVPLQMVSNFYIIRVTRPLNLLLCLKFIADFYPHSNLQTRKRLSHTHTHTHIAAAEAEAAQREHSVFQLWCSEQCASEVLSMVLFCL